MPRIQVPWAFWARFECQNGKKQGKLVYLKDGQSLEDAITEVHATCNKISEETGVGFWLEDYHPVMKDVDAVPVGYRLT